MKGMKALFVAMVAALAAATAAGQNAPARLVYPIGEKSEQIMLDLRQKKRVKVYDLFKKN